jgi:four helix bundle protein
MDEGGTDSAAGRERRPGGVRRRQPRLARLALVLVTGCEGVDRELRGRAAALNDQLQRAAGSVLANVGEALDEPSPGDKRRFLRYARRSAGECDRLLRALARLHHLTPRSATTALNLVRDIKMDIDRLIRWSAR